MILSDVNRGFFGDTQPRKTVILATREIVRNSMGGDGTSISVRRPESVSRMWTRVGITEHATERIERQDHGPASSCVELDARSSESSRGRRLIRPVGGLIGRSRPEEPECKTHLI